MAAALTVLDRHNESGITNGLSLRATVWPTNAIKPVEEMLQVGRLRPRGNGDLPSQRIRILTALAYDVDSGNYLMISVDGDRTSLLPADRGSVLRALKVLGLEREEDLACGQTSNNECKVLSQRELQVLQGVADGFSNKEIAQRLDIGENTTKRHLQRIFAKLGVFSRTQAVTFALTHGWITLAQQSSNT